MRASLLLMSLCACDRGDKVLDSTAPSESLPLDSVDEPVSVGRYIPLTVHVTLDGASVAGATVSLGGNPARWTTDADGAALIQIDTAVPGQPTVLASHPDARIDGEELDLDALEDPVEIALTSFLTTDNTAYEFQDPGDLDHRDSTGQCAHCHLTINDDWVGSAHRQSASNPHVQDLYAGAAAAFDDEARCLEQGGQWWLGIAPGTGRSDYRCYLGDGALPALNSDCGVEAPCDGVAANTGGCADCHAPGIDGVLGGRDLLEATGLAYDYGVHCDVCHKVEDIDLDASPGVAGRLKILRPSEPSPSPVLGEFAPLTFGPYDDVLNPRMGSVARDLFHEATLCAGCHELQQPPAIPGTAADSVRWPDGVLPLQTTFSEWLAGPYGDKAPCQSCHMPPATETGNSADLGNIILEDDPDLATGWYRAPGDVRRHTWTGPRTEDGRLLKLAAALFLSAESDPDTGELVVAVNTRNAGAGHAIPTGEPLRSIILRVEATCAGVPLTPTGGDAVPDFGGWLDRKSSDEDWSNWAGAEPGQVIRVVRRAGWRDYTGTGPFGDGSFDAEDKGLPEDLVVGQATILSVSGDSVVLDSALPAGDLAYRVGGADLPEDGDPISAAAGAPGFGFARLLGGVDGKAGVPSFMASDVISDNRLLPQHSFDTTHRFEGSCEDPADLVVRAALYYRSAPLDLSAQRGWETTDTLMVEGRL